MRAPRGGSHGRSPGLPRQELCPLFEMLELRRFVGQLEVTAADVVAIDLVDANRVLDQREGIERCLVALAAARGVSFEHRREIGLESRMDHPAVSAAGTPTEIILL